VFKETNWLACLLFLVFLVVLRLTWLYYADFALSPDESQYWFWSKHLDWGYYSKPPAVAFIIWISTSLLGDSEFAVRILSPVLHFFTALLVYAIGKELYYPKVGRWSAAIYITLPAVFFSSMLLSTDPILIFFWSASMYLFIRAIKADTWLYWMSASITAGLGMLTKYNMAIFLLSAVVFLLSSQQEKKHLSSTKFWSALVMTFIIWLPNIIWNVNHGFVNFQHTAELAGMESSKTYNPQGLLKFFLEQFILFGPITFAAFIIIAAYLLKNLMTVEHKFLLAFSLPFLFVIMAIALKDHAHANWAAPAYIAATILFCSFFIEAKKVMVVRVVFALHLIIGLIGLSYPYFNKIHRLSFNFKEDPVARLEFGREIGRVVNTISVQYPNATIAADDRKILAWLLFYSKPEVYKWNPGSGVNDHFDLAYNVGKYRGKEIILLSKDYDVNQLKKYSPAVHLIKTLPYRKGEIIKIYHLVKFIGY
jgi:4-amino-4-deoxy-L-arabinose transferase-like glycosyltransferase